MGGWVAAWVRGGGAPPRSRTALLVLDDLRGAAVVGGKGGQAARHCLHHSQAKGLVQRGLHKRAAQVCDVAIELAVAHTVLLGHNPAEAAAHVQLLFMRGQGAHAQARACCKGMGRGGSGRGRGGQGHAGRARLGAAHLDDGMHLLALGRLLAVHGLRGVDDAAWECTTEGGGAGGRKAAL